MSPKRFRIAFSFAGEKRDFVEKTAAILAERFGKEAILYDHYFEALFARADLGILLPDLYHKETDLVVLVLCKDYENKEWCGLEWTAIHALFKERKPQDVQLCRFDHVLIKGLYSTAGFIELESKTPEQFANLILERLADNEGYPQNHYTKHVSKAPFALKTSIPHNLPTLQPFFGREDELKKIADALDPDSRTWGALIDGPGGMGKTSLAVRAAYDASPEVFKKIIFISLKTRELDDDGVRDLSGFLISGLVELLNELARELGRDDIVKAAEDQRPRLLLDALRGEQALLVLDNLESLLKRERDTLFTFVKKLPSGCKAILTSRGRIGSGAEELILEKLSQEAALETLAELATHNPLLAQTSEAERLVLYRETAGKPLLLRWTAGQLGRGHCLTFTDALQYIRSCPPDNDPLEFIFGDLAEDFIEPETRALCALTYFTLPARVKDIHAIADPSNDWKAHDKFHLDTEERSESSSKPRGELSLAQVESALRSLVNRSLAVPTDELRSFTLVPMVADFLRKKKPEVVTETGNRLEKRAYALIIENGFEKHELFPNLEAAWPSISPALPLFLEGSNARLNIVCTALHYFLHFQGRWDEQLAFCEKAEVRALAEGDHSGAGWRAYDCGMIHYLRQQADAVLSCADRATAHWELAKADIRPQALAIRLRGIGYELKGDFSAALTAYNKCLELQRNAGGGDDLACVLNDIALVAKRFGDFTTAEKCYREALGMAVDSGYAEGVAFITGNLANLAIDRKEWLTAELLAREALSFSQAIHRQELIASSNRYLAHALFMQDKPQEALPHARVAVEIYNRLGSPELTKTQFLLTACEAVV